ncbi:MAG: hypothetical protein IJ802_04575 [Kiritimatiellae bacterium]|nr:hypothetical protein [Kiritimatiellia bacterium]
MRIILNIFAAAALIACSVPAAADTVKATGIGGTYRSAVNEALVAAMEQHEGVSVSAETRSGVAESQSVTTTTADGRMSKSELNDSISRDMQIWAKGKILSYTVLSDSFDAATGNYRVSVAAEFAGRTIVGHDPDLRRRMAIAPFRTHGETATFYGQQFSTVEWTMALADKLNIALAQTRKFTMLDRHFDAEVNDELARISGANAAPADFVKLKQQLATDYLVAGEVRFADVAAPGVNPITGRPLPVASQLFAEVTYRVLIAATGQLKWTDVVKVDARDVAAPDFASFMSGSAESVAIQIADGIMDNILPLEIVAKTALGTIVIGEGGKSTKVGDIFTVFALGEKVVDSRTGEVLDRIEEPVGAVRITRVTPKLSYAEVIEGDARIIGVGMRLRRPETVESAPTAPAAPANTTIYATPSGGIVTPF